VVNPSSECGEADFVSGCTVCPVASCLLVRKMRHFPGAGHLGYAICRRRRPKGARGAGGDACAGSAVLESSLHLRLCYIPSSTHRARTSTSRANSWHGRRTRATPHYDSELKQCNQHSFVSLLKAVRDMPRACPKRLLFKMEGMPHQTPLER
jgi:hypothetical protein